jgi:multidrug efflux pump subunit AcrB
LFPRGFTGQSLFVAVPWQNAPTQEVLDKITLPLEEELSTVHGLDRLNSFSALGFSRVFLRFKQGTDMDVAIARCGIGSSARLLSRRTRTACSSKAMRRAFLYASLVSRLIPASRTVTTSWEVLRLNGLMASPT